MRKIAIAALILFAIAVLVQDFFKDKRANTPVAPRPYVIMLSLDGFRYDYTDKTQTPTFDSIAKYGVKAKGLQPVFPTLTFPNHYSIATGLYAGNHGLIANNFLVENLDQFYSPSNRLMVQNGDYYGGEPIWVTAGSNRLKTASYFWVGTEAVIKGYQPDIWKPYDAQITYPARLDSVVSWLNKPYDQRPHLVTCYIELADNLGHHQGPDSKEMEEAVVYIDSLIGSFARKLNQLSIKDSINFVIVSDHGMAPTDSSKVVYLSKYLKPPG
jgi:alkaline phosphatase D